MTEEPLEVTQRGFPIYGRGKDDHAHTWRIQESSRAMIQGEPEGPWAWLFIEEQQDVQCESLDHLHLDLPDAIALRNALDAFIASCDD